MNKTDRPLRFDHREIAVIFILFVLVSLLLFTVGIVVGKGFTVAKHEKMGAGARHALNEGIPAERLEESKIGGKKKHASLSPVDMSPPKEYQLAEALDNHGNPKAKRPPLKLVPKNKNNPNLYGGSLREPSLKHNAKTKKLLKNPKLAGLLEDESGDKRRSIASVNPTSYSNGKYTVQIGSYPREQDARERIAALKKMGFQHAYFSVKHLRSKNQTWFRVWLGHYPDYKTAEKNAKILQQRGEVKNYIVRTTKNSQG